MDLIQPHPKHLPPPTNMEHVFFTLPIMAYIMKRGDNMNGGLIKSKKKLGHWTSAETPPLVDLIHQNVFYITSIREG